MERDRDVSRGVLKVDPRMFRQILSKLGETRSGDARAIHLLTCYRLANLNLLLGTEPRFKPSSAYSKLS